MKKETFYVYAVLQDRTSDPREQYVGEVEGKAQARKAAQALATAAGLLDTSLISGVFFVNGQNEGRESFKVVPDGYIEDEDNGGMLGW